MKLASTALARPHPLQLGALRFRSGLHRAAVSFRDAAHADCFRPLVIEFPDASCIQGAPIAYQAAMKASRSAFLSAFGRPTAKFVKLPKPRRVKVTGVVFFDYNHGQVGAAQNGIELHPVLDLEVYK